MFFDKSGNHVSRQKTAATFNKKRPVYWTGEFFAWKGQKMSMITTLLDRENIPRKEPQVSFSFFLPLALEPKSFTPYFSITSFFLILLLHLFPCNEDKKGTENLERLKEDGSTFFSKSMASLEKVQTNRNRSGKK